MTDLRLNGTQVNNGNPKAKKHCMKKLMMGVFCTFSLFATAQNYTLAWEDNFEKSALDEKKWTVIINGKGGGNRELQYYRRENISIENEPSTGAKCLVLTARKENYHFKKCTSGKLISLNKMSFKYGKVEARIKFPRTADGLWPAFWLLGADHPQVGWPKSGEIDVVEMGNANGIKDSTQQKLFNGACHWGEKFNHGAYPNFAKASVNPYVLQDDFHLFTLIWDENNIKMYLDLDKYPENKPYFEMPIQGDGAKNHPSRYFNKPFYLIFNLAVGGNFPQIRKIDKITALANGEAKMYVDYIRVYQKGSPNDKIVIHE